MNAFAKLQSGAVGVVGGVGHLLQRSRPIPPRCVVCHQAVLHGEPRLRFHGETYVHRRCATYRMREVRRGDDRLGFPPRS